MPDEPWLPLSARHDLEREKQFDILHEDVPDWLAEPLQKWIRERSIYGTWHQVSVKHLGRYVNEATFRLNEGNVERHTLDRLASFVEHAFRVRTTYGELTA